MMLSLVILMFLIFRIRLGLFRVAYLGLNILFSVFLKPHGRVVQTHGRVVQHTGVHVHFLVVHGSCTRACIWRNTGSRSCHNGARSCVWFFNKAPLGKCTNGQPNHIHSQSHFKHTVTTSQITQFEPQLAHASSITGSTMEIPSFSF